ncbi:hypothetical protein [Photobacterium damselae]|uniref:hypothetical protein n=1 Tax=Photobacterium damselae TaxID=38293 RepID=UPI001F3986C3|nr:hypothetical protein [Photobacterium damselae]UKA04676.1 hypothetical protein IHC89_23950 [Photobacterium damselae subsp. damselae]
MKNVAASLFLLIALTGCNHSQYDNNVPEPTPKPIVPDVKQSNNPDLPVSEAKKNSDHSVNISIGSGDCRRVEQNTKVTVSCGDREQKSNKKHRRRVQPFAFSLMPWYIWRTF